MTSPDDGAALWLQLEALALPRDVVARDRLDLELSAHAIERYRERVERVCHTIARRRLGELAADSVWQSLPEPWTLVVLHDDTLYGYPRRRPDVCLLERDGCIVTVLSQRFVRTRARYETTA